MNTKNYITASLLIIAISTLEFCRPENNNKTTAKVLELKPNIDANLDTVIWTIYSLNFRIRDYCQSDTFSASEMNICIYNSAYNEKYRSTSYLYYFYHTDSTKYCFINKVKYNLIIVDSLGCILPAIFNIKNNDFKTKKSIANYLNSCSDSLKNYLLMNKNNPKISDWLKRRISN